MQVIDPVSDSGHLPKIKFDIMLNGRYVCTMKMPFNPLFPIKESEFGEFISKHRPSLSGKPYNIVFY